VVFSPVKKMRISVLAALIVVEAAAGQGLAADVQLRSNATVSTSVVLVNDVATVTGDGATVAAIQKIVLSPAPAPGKRLRLDFESIRSRLEAAGIPAVETNYSGSTVIVVESLQPVIKAAIPQRRRSKHQHAAKVSPAQERRAAQVLEDRIRKHIKSHQPGAVKMFLNVEVDPADVALVLASGAEECEVGVINANAAGMQNVNVRIEDAKGKWNTIAVHCTLSERPQVLVAAHTFTAGQVIRESDLAWRQVDNADGLLTHIEDVINKEVKKSVHAEEPIRADDVRNVPLVRTNDIVTGTWKSGRVRITGQFKAKSDGALGDVIMLGKLMGREELPARVTDLHEAEILSATSAAALRRGGTETDEESTGPSVSRLSRPVRLQKPTRTVSKPIPPMEVAEGDRS
jgi:flagella basal body P-ring formation protein FlgA